MNSRDIIFLKSERNIPEDIKYLLSSISNSIRELETKNIFLFNDISHLRVYDKDSEAYVRSQIVGDDTYYEEITPPESNIHLFTARGTIAVMIVPEKFSDVYFKRSFFVREFPQSKEDFQEFVDDRIAKCPDTVRVDTTSYNMLIERSDTDKSTNLYFMRVC